MDPAWSEALLERVLASENLRKAWRQVKANPGAPGVEGRTIEEFPALAREHGVSMRQAVRDETDPPSPGRRTESPQRHGQGQRWFGMPTVGDRLLQHARAQGLGALCAPGFSTSSCGCRPGRSTPHAGQPRQGYRKRGDKGAVALDLAKCCDRVNHEALRARVARQVRDQALLRLIGQYLRAGVLVGESLPPPAAGVPPGSIGMKRME